MTRAQLIALAERVEKAEGPDRELDVEIVWRITPGIVGVERGPLNGDGTDYLFEWQPSRPWSASWLDVPAYTASLDAAVSLASDWVIASMGDLVADRLPGAVLLVSTDPVKHTTGVGYGTRESGCLARALVAAALRARAEGAA